MHNLKRYIFSIVITTTAIGCCIFGPAAIARYHDASIINHVVFEDREDSEGLRYLMDSDEKRFIAADEKLTIIANALNNRIMPQSDYAALIRLQTIPANESQLYTMLPNYKKQSIEKSEKEAEMGALMVALAELWELGIIPVVKGDFDAQDYAFSYFLAIDMLEPQKNVPLVHIEFAHTQQLNRIRDILVSCYMDTDTHKIYSLSIRADKSWQSYDTDAIASAWCTYLGVNAPVKMESDNLLAENTTSFVKYRINGVDGNTIILTIGFFEGINEFFIKIA